MGNKKKKTVAATGMVNNAAPEEMRNADVRIRNQSDNKGYTCGLKIL